MPKKSEKYKVCFIANEYPGFGLMGGFGVLTRDLAEGLHKKGIETCVLAPKSPKMPQKTIEYVNGIKVIGVPRDKIKRMFSPGLYKLPEADIYHSEEILVDSYFAAVNNPNAKHIVTYQDPPYFDELWKLEELRGNRNLLKKLIFWIKYQLRRRVILKAVKKMDEHYSEAKFLIKKSNEMFNIKKENKFLPNPLRMPKERITKAKKPTVCFLGRWDVQKRPNMFLELSKKFPDVEFIAMGKGQEDSDYDKNLRQKYKNVKNLKMVGYVTEREKQEILNKSWVLLSTSVREGLPIAFLEALSRNCALVSYVNPDNLASNYGYWAKNEDFEDGLKWVLEKNRWKILGRKGHEYVKINHEFNKVINQHIDIYKKILS